MRSHCQVKLVMTVTSLEAAFVVLGQGCLFVRMYMNHFLRYL